MQSISTNISRQESTQSRNLSVQYFGDFIWSDVIQYELTVLYNMDSVTLSHCQCNPTLCNLVKCTFPTVNSTIYQVFVYLLFLANKGPFMWRQHFFWVMLLKTTLHHCDFKVKCSISHKIRATLLTVRAAAANFFSLAD